MLSTFHTPAPFIATRSLWDEYAADAGRFSSDVDRNWLTEDGKRISEILPDSAGARRFKTIIADVEDLVERFCGDRSPRVDADDFYDETRTLTREARTLLEDLAPDSPILKVLLQRWDNSRARYVRPWKAAQQ